MTNNDHQHGDDTAPEALEVITISVTHPQGFGDHIFNYESVSDLFKCERCGRYEITVRDDETGAITECTGPAA